MCKKTGLLFVLLFSLSNAQNISNEIMVTTLTKSERSIDGVSSSVIVITRDEIEKSGAGTLYDILKNIPSISLQGHSFPSASSKTKSGLSIRGTGSSGVLFLINGRRIANEVKNPYEIDRLSASLVERIEIIKGPSSALYGSDALGGVINIITKQPTDDFQGSAGLRGETNHKGKGSKANIDADVSGKIDRFSYSLSANYMRDLGYRKTKIADIYMPSQSGGTMIITKPSSSTINNSLFGGSIKDYYNSYESQSEEATIKNFKTRVEYEFLDNMFLGVDLSYMQEERDGYYIAYTHPSNVTAPSGGKVVILNVPVHSHDNNRRLDLGIDYKTYISEDTKLFARIYQSRYKKRNKVTSLIWEDMKFDSQESSALNALNANVRLTTYEGYLQSAIFENHFLTVGGEYREEDRKGTVFNMAGTMERRSVEYKAAYMQDEYSFNDELNFIFGVRYDAISNADNKATFKVGASYRVFDFSYLRASFSQGYRVPDIREKYIKKQTPTGLQLGSDVVYGPKTSKYNLRPESVNAYEIGMGGSLDKFKYDIAFFYNDITDKIEVVNKGLYYTFENIDDAYTYGVEFAMSYDFIKEFGIGLTYAGIKTEDRSTKKPLLLTPKHNVRFVTDFRPLDNLSIRGIVRYIGKQDYEYSDMSTLIPQVGVDTIRKSTNGETYFDIEANYKTKEFLIYAGVDNIFHKKQDENFFVDLGVKFYAGFRYYF